MTGVQTCALPISEREQALARQTSEARAERLARARERVELFARPAPQPRVELFGNAAGGTQSGTSGSTTKPRIELFGSGGKPDQSSNARTAEEA